MTRPRRIPLWLVLPAAASFAVVGWAGYLVIGGMLDLAVATIASMIFAVAVVWPGG